MSVKPVLPYVFAPEQIRDAKQSLQNLRILRTELDKAVRAGIDVTEELAENSVLQRKYENFLKVYGGN